MTRLAVTLLILAFTPTSPAAQSSGNQQPLNIADSLNIYDSLMMERITVVGAPSWKTDIAGAASYIERADLQRQNYSDVHRVLRSVSGVNIQEEDGFGLRPNIGMRGTGVERSTKINIMEDGVLIAPAPYSAPAAYYFPNVKRMNAVEVRKGSSQIKYGPNTTGGAINMISTRIPHELSGEAELNVGEHNSNQFYGHIGNSGENSGFLLEGLQMRNEGFKELDSGGDTGFRVYDLMGKTMIRTNPNARLYQRLDLKAGFYDEKSNETYLGLTRDDFQARPFRRYAASAEDKMDAHHRQLTARHFAQFSPRLDLTTTIYRHDFSRDWYKLQSVHGESIAKVLSSPGQHNEAIGYLKGTDSPDNTLIVRSNNREYFSHGVQSALALTVESGEVENQFELGLRLHQDEEDRFQYEDGYRMQGGSMILTDPGSPGSHANRIGSATAVAVYLKDNIRYNNWTFSPGVRYEHIRFKRSDYGTNDPDRTGSALSRQSYTVDVLVPGTGATYRLTDQFTLITGIHKGFSPPSPGSGSETKPEESVNYETGFRFENHFLDGEVIGYFNNYSNLLGSDLEAGGGGGTTAQFNAGSVQVYGVEASAGFDLADLEWLSTLPVSLPVNLNYTFTKATFRSDFDSSFGPWGSVRSGDHLPFIPTHQFSTGISAVYETLELNLNASTTSRMRTAAGSGPIEETSGTDSYLLLDVSTSYQVTSSLTAFANVRNLLNQHYIVSDRPAGLRPGLPRTLTGGIRLSI